MYDQKSNQKQVVIVPFLCLKRAGVFIASKCLKTLLSYSVFNKFHNRYWQLMECHVFFQLKKWCIDWNVWVFITSECIKLLNCTLPYSTVSKLHSISKIIMFLGAKNLPNVSETEETSVSNQDRNKPTSSGLGVKTLATELWEWWKDHHSNSSSSQSESED